MKLAREEKEQDTIILLSDLSKNMYRMVVCADCSTSIWSRRPSLVVALSRI